MWRIDNPGLLDYKQCAVYQRSTVTDNTARKQHNMSDVADIYEFSENPADATQPPLLADAEYRATVRGAVLGKAKGSGNTMITLDYVIAPEQYPADFAEGDPDGTVGKGYIVVEDSPQGRFRYKRACEMHGVTPSKRVDPNAFMGQEVIVRVSSETREGLKVYKPFNAVRAV
jgi:hypothetical protein